MGRSRLLRVVTGGKRRNERRGVALADAAKFVDDFNTIYLAGLRTLAKA